MALTNITKLVYSVLEINGYKGKIVSIRHLDDLKEEIQARYKEGVFDINFYQERLSYFQFEIPDTSTNISSIIITSAIQPQKRVSFIFKGKQHYFVVPPTYSYGTDQMVEKVLLDIIKPRGFNLLPVKLPLKLLAVRSGLTKYGRNNIAYIEGAGSFHRLKAFFSDIPANEDNWGSLEMLEQCENCNVCQKKCPTGAIVPHRFVIRAERCLTFHNERNNDFPSWIKQSWHNCVIGCMTCQSVCPANKTSKNWIKDDGEFSEEETRLLLRGVKHELTGVVTNKLQKLGLLEDFDLLPRNLSVLFS